MSIDTMTSYCEVGESLGGRKLVGREASGVLMEKKGFTHRVLEYTPGRRKGIPS